MSDVHFTCNSLQEDIRIAIKSWFLKAIEEPKELLHGLQEPIIKIFEAFKIKETQDFKSRFMMVFATKFWFCQLSLFVCVYPHL